MIGNIVKPTIEEIARYTTQITLQSSIGDAAHDIFIDMPPTGEDEYLIIEGIAQTQDAGVAKNAAGFLCPPTYGNNSSPLDPNSGKISQSKIGALIGFDGAVFPNIGDFFLMANQLIVVPPRGWFLRFVTDAPAGFPAGGSQFTVWVTYSSHKISPCVC